MVPGARLYPLVPPLPVLSSLKSDHLLSAVVPAYARRADGGRAEIRSTSRGASRPARTWRPFDDEPHLVARMPDHELWMTFFRDPDRNLHGVMAEVRA